MANKKTTSFIPYQDHSIIKGYALTSSFSDANVNLDKISDKYENYLNGLIKGREVPNQHALSKAMGTLQKLVDQERNAELSFLSELGVLGITMNNTEAAWKDLIQSFNLIFSTEEVFERNITKLKQLEASGGKRRYRDITQFLRSTYLPKAIQEFTPIKSIDDVDDKLVLKIMRRAVELMFQATDKDIGGKEEIQAYKEMWEALQKLTYRNVLFKNLASLFKLDEYLTGNLDELNSIKEYSNYPDITATQQNPAGYVYEQIEAAAVGQLLKMGSTSTSSGMFSLTTQVVQTGSTFQKADNVVVLAEGHIDTRPMISGNQRKDNSIRLRSVERIENLLEKIGEKKAQIVFMTDKNYVLGNYTHHSKHKGFTAEDPSLSSLSTYGAQFHIPNVTGMIEYLANAGDSMIVNDIESCMRVIETCIGNFLFDDLQIQAPPSMNVNRVHLLSLSGVYMPASVYLEATLQGLLGIGNLDAEELVNASFNPSFKDPGKATKAAWDAFIENRKKEKIHISFMAGYSKFMDTLFK